MTTRLPSDVDQAERRFLAGQSVIPRMSVPTDADRVTATRQREQQAGGSAGGGEGTSPRATDGGTTGSGTTTGAGTTGSGGSVTPPPPITPASPFGTQNVGGAVIPEGATLLRLTEPGGDIYYLEYESYGVKLRFEIGTADDVTAVFGSATNFQAMRTVSQEGFDADPNLLMGTVDEALGATESIESMIRRDLREAGREDVPQWIRDDPAAMLIVMTGAKESWSAGRIATELTRTTGFAARHPGFAALKQAAPNASVLELTEDYYDRERKITEVLRRYRGPDTPADPAYVGSLISTGWKPEGVAQVLEGERLLRQSPAAFQTLNAILTQAGKPAVTEEGFLEIMRGNAEPEVYELVNDTNRKLALAAAGVDITTGAAAELGAGSSSQIAGEGAFDEGARLAALNIIANRYDLNAARYGLTREQIVKAAFGEAPGDVYDRLNQLGRERSAAGEGLGGFSAYQDEQGRLRVAGLKGL